jgi:hypothetical protein
MVEGSILPLPMVPLPLTFPFPLATRMLFCECEHVSMNKQANIFKNIMLMLMSTKYNLTHRMDYLVTKEYFSRCHG